MQRTARLDDVAEAAGVSPKTVSRVVNGDPQVSPRTREAVEAMITKLGYRPNLAARSLASSRSTLIGVLSVHLRGYYFSELHRGAIQASKERHYHLAIEELDSNYDNALRQLKKTLSQMQFEGLILTPPITDDERILRILKRQKIRYVRISPFKDASNRDSVSTNESQSLEALAEYFWALGHRRFGLIAICEELASRQRHEVLRQRLISLGATDENIQILHRAWRGDAMLEGRKAAAALLSSPQRPTAIFAFNDETAAAVIAYAHEHGLKVPGDLSVAGFDDSDFASMLWPPLTTIRQPIKELAASAVSLLLDAPGATPIAPPSQLIIRSSTGVAPSAPP